MLSCTVFKGYIGSIECVVAVSEVIVRIVAKVEADLAASAPVIMCNCHHVGTMFRVILVSANNIDGRL